MGRLFALGALLALLGAEQAGSIEGTVRGADGAPVAFARLQARSVTAQRPYSIGTWADARGCYRLRGLPPGTYLVDCVLREPPTVEERAGPEPQSGAPERGDRTTELLLQAFLRALAVAHPHRVEVSAGGTVECDLTLPPLTSLTLRLFDEEGPVPGAEVTLRMVDAQGSAVLAPEFETRRTTSERGEALWPVVPEGWYVPVVRRGCWRAGCGVREIRGTRAGPLAIRLGSCRVGVHVVDARGEPVAVMKLALADRDDRGNAVTTFPPPGARAGTYEIPYVREGTYDLEVEVGSGTARVPGIVVERGAPVPEVEVRMPPMGRVLAWIVDAAGDPLDLSSGRERIFIAKREADGKVESVWTDVSPVARLAGEDQNPVLFDNLTAGRWRIGRVELPGGWDFAEDPVEVEVKGFETTEVTLVVGD